MFINTFDGPNGFVSGCRAVSLWYTPPPPPLIPPPPQKRREKKEEEEEESKDRRRKKCDCWGVNLVVTGSAVAIDYEKYVNENVIRSCMIEWEGRGGGWRGGGDED